MLTSPSGVEELPHSLGGHTDGDHHDFIVLLFVDHDGREVRNRDREDLPVGADDDADVLVGGLHHARQVYGSAARSGLQLEGLVVLERLSEEAELDVLRCLRAPFEEHGNGGVRNTVARSECADAHAGGPQAARNARLHGRAPYALWLIRLNYIITCLLYKVKIYPWVVEG
jgi:hypothetical protein